MVVATQTESDLVAHGRGKWSVAGVPHRGWLCVDIEDLGSPSAECEMCESQTIRYIHHMQHRDYPHVLQVGCVCAGHMEGSLPASRAREASMKSRAGKRSRWHSRRWRCSAKGNPHLKADGYRVTVYKRGQGWAFTLAPVDGGSVLHARRNFADMFAAKLAAFDSITRLLSSRCLHCAVRPRR
jgi:hypothetical protein